MKRHFTYGKALALSAVTLLTTVTVSSQGVYANSMDQQPCIDGHTQQNLVVAIDHGNASVHTLGDAPLCEDTTVNFSSYTMPANYDGNGFYGNPTAYPQPIFDTEQVVLPAGSNGQADMQIDLPDDCNNIQVDVYYGDVVSEVGPDGHGTANILSEVYMSTGECQVEQPEQPGQPGMGGNETPATPVVTEQPAAAPATLANTGTSPVVAYVAAFGLAISTLLGTIFVRRSNV